MNKFTFITSKYGDNLQQINFEDTLEEDFDEESEIQNNYPEFKVNQKVIKNINNWEEEFLD